MQGFGQTGSEEAYRANWWWRKEMGLRRELPSQGREAPKGSLRWWEKKTDTLSLTTTSLEKRLGERAGKKDWWKDGKSLLAFSFRKKKKKRLIKLKFIPSLNVIKIMWSDESTPLDLPVRKRRIRRRRKLWEERRRKRYHAFSVPRHNKLLMKDIYQNP